MAVPAAQSRSSSDSALGPRTPPHSADMEKALLGALLLDGSAFARVSDLLDEGSSYRPVHSLIYGAMSNLDRHHEPIDLVTMAEELKRANRLEEVGGPVYLTELAESMPSAANVEHYARIVHEKSLLRRMISLGTETATSAYESAARADEVFEDLQRRLVQLIGERRGRHAQKADAVLHQTMEYITHLKAGGQYLTGVGSGFDRLDDLTTGFNPGELVIIAARPSMGKTSLAMNVARAAAERHNCSVLIFSLEMEVRQLMLRLLSSESHIGLQKLRTTARLSDEEYVRLAQAAGRLAELPVFFDDTAGVGIETIRARSRQMWIEHKIGMIVVDYLQLIMPPQMADNQQQWVAFLSASLKSLAKELGIPILCLSQLSRAPETRGGDRRPMLSDLRDSGAIEQDADIVMFVYRPEIYKEFIKAKQYEIAGRKYDIEGLAEIIVAKNRNGPTGSVALAFVGKYTMFADVTGEAPPTEEKESYEGEEEVESGAGF
ncbi:MAG: replicative DNA helicase [bacterium]|nr:replicative DNA helicase [bacterium]